MLGYEKKAVRKILVLDHLIDTAISLIPAVIIFYFMADVMMRKDEFSLILSNIDLNGRTGFIQMVLCFVYVHVILVFFENHWMRKGRWV